MDNWDLLTDSLKEFHITLTNEQFHQFQNYYELMIEWNSFMNLTAITEMDEVIMKHFVDSVSLIQAVPDLAKKDYSLIDIGTGAGFPGIPLKIVPTDLFPRELAEILNKPYSGIKICFDVICLLITACMTYFCLGHIMGLGIGAIIAAFTMGKGVAIIGNRIDKYVTFTSFMESRNNKTA